MDSLEPRSHRLVEVDAHHHEMLIIGLTRVKYIVMEMAAKVQNQTKWTCIQKLGEPMVGLLSSELV